MTTAVIPRWPVPEGDPALVLLDASTEVERRVLDEWARREGAGAAALETCRLTSLDAVLDREDDPWLVPVRGVELQGWLRRRHPQRCRVVVGEPARLSTLRGRWRALSADGSGARGLPDFVARQATLALERAETGLVGAKYKVPRLVREDLESTAGFRSGLAVLAHELRRDEADVTAEASSYLEEMVTGWSRLMVDLSVRMGRYSFGRGYDAELDVDPEQVERLREAAKHHPLVFLPSHKSNLDTLVMNVALHDTGLPRTHVIGGINMAFWPVGTLWRHAGLVFIRRSTRGNPVYNFTLREYVGYLLEKRFSLQFYIEGSRSRTGKLSPPKLGLLTYIANAYRQGRSEDVVLVPVSISYDQLQEVGDFAREAKGGSKRTESISWLVRAFREQSGRYGKVYVRFGDPLSLQEALGPADGQLGDEEDRLSLHKVALEVSRRINEVTPITATSVVTLTLLGAKGRALTAEQVLATVHDPLEHACRRQLPLARQLDLDTVEGVRSALDELTRHHVVVPYESGPDAVYAIGPDQHLAAAFYRNSVIHFFLHGAIAQTALARAGRAGVEDPLATFWNTAYLVRDLLKFEFFFEPRKEFRDTVEAELSLHDPDWAKRVGSGATQARRLLEELRPLTAHTVLQSFLEASSVVAAALVRHDGDEIEEKAFLSSCLALGRQYHLQQRIHSPESLSRPLFSNGFKLATGRGLTGPTTDKQAQRAFLDEVRDVLRDLEVVQSLATSRVLSLVEAVTS